MRRGVPTRGTPTTTTCGGVQRGTASLAGVWGTPPEIFISTTTCGGSPEGHSLFGRGLGVSPRDPLFLLLHAGGVQRGTASLAGVWGCPPEIFYFCYYVRGESRGAQPLWQGSGGVPQRSFISATTCGGSPEGHSLFGRGLGVSPRDPLFLLLHAGGVQRGTASLAGVWGCPPEIFYFFPLPPRKGARGMARATIETTRSEAEVPHPTPPQIATSQPPRNDRGVVARRGFDIRHLTSVIACPTLASTKAVNAVNGFIRLQDLAEKRLQMCSEPCQIRRTPDGLCSSNQRSAPALAF